MNLDLKYIIFRDNVGETVIFQWVEMIREVLQTVCKVEKKIEVTEPEVDSLDLTTVYVL